MKARFTPILLILVIVAAAILSRFIGGSDYILAATSSVQGYAYRFVFCPYNKKPYTIYPKLYPGYPGKRFPYPYAYPFPKQYPCPCVVPALEPLSQDGYSQ